VRRSRNISFYKISAAGNDFILIDNRKNILPADVSALAAQMCNRKFAVGADGLIALENSSAADFRMKFFNSDGSEAEMCGNGARSLARFAFKIGAAGKKMAFETGAGLVSAEILKEDVRIQLSTPKDIRLDFVLKVDKREFNASFINTGVPHTVIYVNDIEKADVVNIGRAVRYHREFAPAGTNVNFVQVKDRQTLLVRTYERGVEDETLACGTGVTASAVVSGIKGLVTSPASCVTRGGYKLIVSYKLNDSGDLISPVDNVFLEGPADIAFSGEMEI
jgi:diaminopimelate epimerase